MHRLITALTGLTILSAGASAAVEGYYRYPTIHGDVVVFASENDLWRVTTAGGLAARITTHPGNEGFPKFSPNGAKLAFSAEYGGNIDAYVMPAGGGEPQRLTHHPERDEVVAWRGDEVVFRSRRQHAHRAVELFAVPTTGGNPTPLGFGWGALADFSPDGSRVVFNRISREFRTWKRYRGGLAQDVWLIDYENRVVEQLTDFEGTDAWPMWANQRVYFVSDRSGRANIFSTDLTGGDVQQHTSHTDYDVRWPDTDGQQIVYTLGADLWLLDLAQNTNRKLVVTLPTDRLDARGRMGDPAKAFDSFALSPDGKRVAIAARGELWVRPAKEGRIIPLAQTPGIRERAVAFSHDGEHLAVISDKTGEQELYILDAAGKEPPRQLTTAGKGWIFPPVWSPDGKHVAYSDLEFALHVVNVESGQRRLVDDAAGWEIKNYSFSPDSQWLAYERPSKDWNDSASIWLYSVADDRTFPVTDQFTNDFNPAWDPEGRFLYFLSNRLVRPMLDSRDFIAAAPTSAKPYVVILAADGVSPFLPDEMQPQTDDAENEDQASDDADDDKSTSAPEVKIDLEGIGRRIIETPVAPGNYQALSATKGKLLFMSEPTPVLDDSSFFDRTPPKRTLMALDIKKQETDTAIADLQSYTISADGKQIAWRTDGRIHVAPLKSLPIKPDDESVETVELASLPLPVTPPDEWRQIFNEAWRLQRDFFWAENMTGVDWSAERERYAKLLDRIGTRDELNDVVGQLIAELGTSHTYVWGGDVRAAPNVAVGVLGADLVFDEQAGAYRFDRVLQPEPWESDVHAPLTMPPVNIDEGDYLFAINHRPLTATDNPFEPLAGLAGNYAMLTVGDAPDRNAARDVQTAVLSLAQERELRYRDWVRRNREWVAEQSDGRIGYVHLPDMGGRGLTAFMRSFYPQHQKPGLIFDLRYNGGGFVSQLIIQVLARESWAFGKPRRGQVYTYPAVTHRGHKLTIINEFSGSDGDIFPESFKLLRLGPVIGKRTWGGVVGIRGDKPFIDGGMSTQPEFSWWQPDRRYALENEGVEPDIEVPYPPGAYLDNQDPQLESAVSIISQMIEQEPVSPIDFGDYPDTSLQSGK